MISKMSQVEPDNQQERYTPKADTLFPAGREIKRIYFLLQTIVPVAIAVLVFSAGFLGGGSVWLAALAALVSAAVVAALLRVTISRLNQERRNFDDQLLQSQKLAALGEMAAGIAHEINTPLAIIGMEIDWMEHLIANDGEEKKQSQEQLKESLSQLNGQVQRCAEITHSILGFAAKRKAVEQLVDLKKLTDDMVRWLERDAKQRNIKIIKEYSPQVPEVSIDPPLLRQVLLNLLNNAYQAVDQNGFIRINIYKSDSTACIEVRDNGCGIPSDHLNKIFNPFFTTKAPGKGTGLGLSISMAIIDRLGGTLSVVSKPGEGTAFTISLPLKDR